MHCQGIWVELGLLPTHIQMWVEVGSTRVAMAMNINKPESKLYPVRYVRTHVTRVWFALIWLGTKPRLDMYNGRFIPTRLVSAVHNDAQAFKESTKYK